VSQLKQRWRTRPLCCPQYELGSFLPIELIDGEGPAWIVSQCEVIQLVAGASGLFPIRPCRNCRSPGPSRSSLRPVFGCDETLSGDRPRSFGVAFRLWTTILTLGVAVGPDHIGLDDVPTRAYRSCSNPS